MGLFSSSVAPAATPEFLRQYDRLRIHDTFHGSFDREVPFLAPPLPFTAFHCLSLPFTAFHSLSLPFLAPSLPLFAFHCLSLTFPCLSLPFPDLSLTFNCLSLTFHCLSLPFQVIHFDPPSPPTTRTTSGSPPASPPRQPGLHVEAGRSGFERTLAASIVGCGPAFLLCFHCRSLCFR